MTKTIDKQLHTHITLWRSSLSISYCVTKRRHTPLAPVVLRRTGANTCTKPICAAKLPLAIRDAECLAQDVDDVVQRLREEEAHLRVALQAARLDGDLVGLALGVDERHSSVAVEVQVRDGDALWD